MPAYSAHFPMTVASIPLAANSAGVNLIPSMNKVKGARRRNDIIVMMENKLMLSIESFLSFELPMSFLLRTLRLWNVRLLPMAARNPAQLNEDSVQEASATPNTMGSSDATIGSVGVSPKKMAERATLKKGSIALMVCVKDTATFPRLTLVSKFPRACTPARGTILSSVSLSTLGKECALVTHIVQTMVIPIANCIRVHVQGYGNTFNTCLLYILNQMLNRYHPPKSAPRYRVSPQLLDSSADAPAASSAARTTRPARAANC
mmetsp:Transcript_31991/g.38712  ORF Transcript_31991/g.38712 Transcript_31991/m.38712 type:complete len:262 (+) Transcript_31991:859-1644(+)